MWKIMTIKQRQALLFYLGYYVGNVDGIWGQLSKIAVKSFQQDYGFKNATGNCDADTEKAMRHAVCYGMPAKKVTDGDGWDDIEFFTRDEFKCTCGGRYCNGFPVEPDMNLVRILNTTRKHFGKPFSPNSAIRCTQRNKEIGGVSNSQHLYGIAADITVPGVAPKTVAAYLETLLPNTGGIGIYSWGVHVDVRKTKSRWNG
jgi:peptidoglycan hydrolase-like protein with peptidoglycan-binding domain